MDQNHYNLWKEYWEKRENTIIIQLMNIYLPLLVKIIDEIVEEHPDPDMNLKDELLSTGIFSLSDAVRSYSPDCNQEFEDHFKPIAYKALKDELTWVLSPYGQIWIKLTGQEQSIVVLHQKEHCSFSAIAELFKLPVETVENTYNSVIAKLPPQ